MQTHFFKMTDAHWNALGKSGPGHKYRYGHAAIVSGPLGRGGAARLAARGALRIGAGVVSVLCKDDALVEHACQLNAIMVKPFGPDISFRGRLSEVDPQAICIGPNLGLGSSSQALLGDVLALGRPVCIDADAITILANGKGFLPKISHAQSVLTPHEGELRRIIPEMFEQTNCRVRLAQTAANKVGCVVLFKGQDTVIASPDHDPVVVSSNRFEHASWLATAGSGDVLSGFVTGLLARGFDGVQAACLAAELHLRCADAFGAGLIAEDIPEILPKILR